VSQVATPADDPAENVNPGSNPFSWRRIVQDIFWGVAIIAIGLFMGGSVFLGEFTVLNFVFDGLGVFFIGKGAVSMMGQSSEQ